MKDEETQRNYLQNLKNLILMENSNKTQEIKPTQYLMDAIFNRFKNIQKPITIEDLKEEIQEIKKQIDQLKQENGQIKQKNEQIRNIIQYKQENSTKTSNNKDLGIIIPDKQTPIESFINTISKIDFQRWYINVKVMIEDFEVEMIALIDLGADMNCIKKIINSYSIL